MKRHWIEYTESRETGPMSFWVHRPIDGLEWHQACRFDPPMPMPTPGRGFPQYYVEFNGFTFRFASLHELRVCIEILSKKLLPSTYRLSRERNVDAGPNSHWLSRLPPKVKPWRYRERAVAYLAKALVDFERETAGDSG